MRMPEFVMNASKLGYVILDGKDYIEIVGYKKIFKSELEFNEDWEILNSPLMRVLR